MLQSNSGLKFTVVEFSEENSIDTISNTWLHNNGKFAYWPSGPNVANLVQRHALPESTWQSYPCKVLKHFDSYAKARQGCKKAENSNNLDTTETEERISKTRKSRRRKLKVSTLKKVSSSTSDKESDGSKSPGISTDNCPPFLTLNSAGAATPTSLTDSPSAQNSNLFIIEDLQNCLGPDNHLAFDNLLRDPANIAFDSTSGLHGHQTEIGNSQAEIDSNVGSSENTAVPGSSHGFEPTELVALKNEFRKFQVVVLTKLVAIHKDVEVLLRRTAGESSVDVVSLNDCPSLPIGTLQELEDLNTWLNTKINLNNLAIHLSVIGGKDGKDVTLRILTRLFSTELGQKISLTGRGGKSEAGIRKTCVIELLKLSVRKNKGFSFVTDKDIDEFIKIWCKNVLDRGGGRDKRRK